MSGNQVHGDFRGERLRMLYTGGNVRVVQQYPGEDHIILAVFSPDVL